MRSCSFFIDEGELLLLAQGLSANALAFSRIHAGLTGGQYEGGEKYIYFQQQYSIADAESHVP